MDPLRNLGFLLRDVSRLWTLNFQRHATELMLTQAQCRVLAYLQRNEGISQARLAELTDTDPMTLARALDRMEAEGWIERRSDPTDRRALRLYLQPYAIPALQEIWRLSDRARTDALAGLSAADREHLMILLERVRGNLGTLLPGASDTNGRAAKPPRKAAVAKRARA